VLGALISGTDADPSANRRRAHAGDVLGEHAHATRKNRATDDRAVVLLDDEMGFWGG